MQGLTFAVVVSAMPDQLMPEDRPATIVSVDSVLGSAETAQPFHPRRGLAVAVDLGDGLPARAGLGRAEGGSAARPGRDNRGIGEPNRGARNARHRPVT